MAVSYRYDMYSRPEYQELMNKLEKLKMLAATKSNGLAGYDSEGRMMAIDFDMA